MTMTCWSSGFLGAEIERHGGAAIHVVTDVSDRAQVEALARAAIDHYGRIG
jgi:NAD(P)-dependent dehydrogenase (short-subunit alcohol dehydrogenase family)